MMLEELREHSRKELAQLAKSYRIRGWHLLKKEELISRLVHAGADGSQIPRQEKPVASAPEREDVSRRLIRKDPGRNDSDRPARLHAAENQILVAQAEEDRLKLDLLESHWFRFSWQLASATLRRAQVSLGMEWSTVKPVLRLYQVDLEPAGTPQEYLVDEIPISNRFREWYVPVPEQEKRFRAKLGLLAASGRFFLLASSEGVDTPAEVAPRVDEAANGSPWMDADAPDAAAEDGLSDLKAVSQLILGRAAPEPVKSSGGPFRVQIDLTLKGTADPGGVLTILGEQIELDGAGAFEVSMPFAPGREVIPVVETTDEGRKKQTVVLTVEQNRRELEPQVLEMMSEFDEDE